MQIIGAAGKFLASVGHTALFDRLNCCPGSYAVSLTSQLIAYPASFPTWDNVGIDPEC
jgi:hypothetical protein